MIGVESAGWTGCMIGSSADDEARSDDEAADGMLGCAGCIGAGSLYAVRTGTHVGHVASVHTRKWSRIWADEAQCGSES